MTCVRDRGIRVLDLALIGAGDGRCMVVVSLLTLDERRASNLGDEYVLDRQLDDGCAGPVLVQEHKRAERIERIHPCNLEEKAYRLPDTQLTAERRDQRLASRREFP